MVPTALGDLTYMLQRNKITWLLLGTLLSGYFCEICKEPDRISPEEMKLLVHQKAIPSGQLHAGYYEADLLAGKNPASCILSCCEKPLCNVAWYTQEKCYTIECDENNENACDPVTQTDIQFDQTLFMQIRSLNETRAIDECQSKNECGENQSCMPNVNQVKRCVCHQGYTRSKTNKTCAKVTMAVSDLCEFGVIDCGENKQCVVLEGSKSRAGTCQCMNGFIEDKTGACVTVNIKDIGNKIDGNTVNGETVVTSLTTKALTLKPDSVTEFPKDVTYTTLAAPKVQILTVSAGESKEIQLPLNEITLTAFALPEESKGEKYAYDWALEAHPEGEMGTMEGKNTNTLKLKQLIAGLYTFRIKVTGVSKFGEAVVNVTVKPRHHRPLSTRGIGGGQRPLQMEAESWRSPEVTHDLLEQAARQNKPPRPQITPVHLEIKLPNSGILDGSDSKDDDKIVSYLWEIVSGPLQEKMISGGEPIFKLIDLMPGNYTIKLTVTDSDGAMNSTTANVTVIKEMDYPPKANAGSDVVIHLPQTSVVLYGNLSTDDKGIVSYEWLQGSVDKLVADMQGARTAELHLTNLAVGDYTFTLKVTDISNQISTADVHVYVKPEQNTPPIAKTTEAMETSLPLDNILLDGSNSTDDQKITSYLWQQTGGPTILTMQDADKMIATASGEIKVGKYMFKLTVKDKEELTSSTTMTVNVKQVANEPPVARAGDDKVIQLPMDLVTLDGSQSTDDHKITEYHWVRDSKSLAAGDILNNSDHMAVLQLVNLVAGRYVFTLTVLDSEGLSSSDQAAVVVKYEEYKKDLMELYLDVEIAQFTEENKKNLVGQLLLLLPKSPNEGDTVITIQNIEEDPLSGNLRVQFYLMNVMRDRKVYRSGVDTVGILKKKLLSSPYMLEYRVVHIDTSVCQNNCSGHGLCNPRTKLCVCEQFWTSNFILTWMQGDSNCHWSVLYVVIVCLLIVMFFVGVLWACFCCWTRKRCWSTRCCPRPKKRHRYSLLKDDDDGEAVEMEMKKKGKIQNSSVMISESDFSSSEDTIFLNQKKANGHLGKNGLMKSTLNMPLNT